MKKGALLRGVLIIGIVCIFGLIPMQVVYGDSVTDTIGVYVGYFGWDEDDYVEKTTYHWSDLDDQFGGALNTRTAVYSYYNGKRTYLAAARGFTVRELMEYAGIDLNSISRLDFFTKDQTVGAYRSFTKYSLLDMPRYYFPNLGAREDTGALYAWNGNDLWEGATRVEAMLALEDYTEWDAVGSEFQKYYNKTMFGSSSRFHLFFGQSDPSEANTSSAAKYVYMVYVTFAGTPILSPEETNLSLKVGSDFQVKIDVEAEDALLNQFVAQHLKWSSSDESILSVDSNGKLLGKKAGHAEITVTFGNTEVSIPVQIEGGEMVLEGSSNQQDEGSETGKVYELSSGLMAKAEYAQWVQKVLEQGSGKRDLISKEKQISNVEMGSDARQLKLLLKKQPKVVMQLAGTLILLFLIGFYYGIARFRTALKDR